MELVRNVISTHAPYTEGDERGLRGFMQNAYFNSRPLYRGRLGRFKHIVRNVAISTHAPYTEGDIGNTQIRYAVKLFQLTPPIQRATPTYIAPIANVLFQLTPPIQRATVRRCKNNRRVDYFNSRPLYRGRPGSIFTPTFRNYFNSRPLYRGRQKTSFLLRKR